MLTLGLAAAAPAGAPAFLPDPLGRPRPLFAPVSPLSTTAAGAAAALFSAFLGSYKQKHVELNHFPIKISLRCIISVNNFSTSLAGSAAAGAAAGASLLLAGRPRFLGEAASAILTWKVN